MQFVKTMKEKCQKLFSPFLPEEDRSIEEHTAQLEEQAKIDSVEDLEAFGISYEKFELDAGVDGPLLPPDENTFFSPSFAKVKNLQPDPDQWTFEDVMDFLGDWPEPKWPFCTEVSRDNAESLCSALSVAFDNLNWKEDGKKDSICLQDQTNWRQGDFSEAFDVNKWRVPGFWHNRKCNSRPQDVWLAKDKPHIMSTIAHSYPNDNSSLLLGEIQAIIALMIVRLVNNSVPEHNIVPVLLYSYTGDKHGRVLQAYTSRENLVIRASKFYDFSATQDAHLKLLLQYMVGDPVGSTMTLKRPQLKSIDIGVDSDSGFSSA